LIEIKREFANFTFLTIATNKYAQYWEEMVKSADSHFSKEDNVNFTVFTDQKNYCESVAAKLKNITVHTIEIESLGWPEATLMRYRYYANFIDEISSEVVCHIDADMLFKQNPLKQLDPESWLEGVALVAHPGFFRSQTYQYDLRTICKDLVRLLRTGGLGTWEQRKKSTAYVPRKNRKCYVCGGIWFAKNSDFSKLVKQLSEATDVDLNAGIVAKWHDESHLNKWSSQNMHTTLTPSLCYDASYKWLMGLPEIIQAVRKVLN
jgi:hypothetical protein